MLNVHKSRLSTNDFESTNVYRSHTIFEHIDMNACVDVSGALKIIRAKFGSDFNIVGDDSSYFEFELSVKSLFDDKFRNEKFWLDFTRLNYGGYRYWLKCLRCKSRRTKLYITSIDVACRECLGLVYTTKSGHKDSALVRLYKYGRAMEIQSKKKKMTYKGLPTRHGRRFKSYYQDLSNLAEQFS